MTAFESGQSPDTDIIKMMEAAWGGETEAGAETQPFERLTMRLWELGINTKDVRSFRALVDDEWLEVASTPIPVINNRGQEAPGIHIIVNQPKDLLLVPDEKLETGTDRVVQIDDYYISLEDGELLHLSSQAECYPGADNEPMTFPTSLTGPLLYPDETTGEVQIFTGTAYRDNFNRADMSDNPNSINHLLGQLSQINPSDVAPITTCSEYFE